MQKFKKPTIWRYLIWGLVIGLIGSLLIIKVFGTESVPITKTVFFQKIFGESISYKMKGVDGNIYTWRYYEYVLDLIQFVLVGVFMGLAVGISNHSVRKTVFSTLGGVIAGLLCFYYVYSNPREGLHFFLDVGLLFIWYALSIVIFLTIFERGKNDFFSYLVTSLIASFSASVVIFLLGLVSLLYTIGLSWSHAKTIDAPLILFGAVTTALLNIAINVNFWKKD